MIESHPGGPPPAPLSAQYQLGKKAVAHQLREGTRRGRTKPMLGPKHGGNAPAHITIKVTPAAR